MTSVLWGALLGGAVGAGLLLALEGVISARRAPFAQRVYPYLRDLPNAEGSRVDGAGSTSLLGVFLSPVLKRSAEIVERVLGGSASIERRLTRAGVEMTVHDFRVEQVIWGLGAFTAAALPSALIAAASPQRAVPLFLCCLIAFALGVLLRENRLTSRVKQRERRILAEFPTLAELLALAVAAGESPLAALERVVSRAHGEMAMELRRVLAACRTGTPLARAFDEFGARSGLPPVARFADGLAIAVERGTPLADVLHAQAGDVREAGRRDLIEAGARAEVAMMVPVVFILLPTVIIFAFFPGLVGLQLVV